MIPVFVDTDEDPTVALNDSAFKPVWDVIKALRSHDDELGKELDELRRQLPGGRIRLPGKIHFDLPARVGVDFACAFDVRLVEQTTASWEFWFGMLKEYVSENGNARVPSTYTVGDYKLGYWVSHQRIYHAKETLSLDRVSRLQQLDGWVWNVQDAQWEEGFSYLQDYVKQNGNALVPLSYQSDYDYKLGQWVATQRTRYNNGKLGPDRVSQLEEVTGWVWSSFDAKWEEGFSRLQDYAKQTGHARVPQDYRDDDDYGLGLWVNSQRNNYDKEILSVDRKRRLEELNGWRWDPHAANWEEGFSYLEDYVKQHGDARVPYGYEVDGYKLRGWVQNQRAKKATGKLDADRVSRLENLHPTWTWASRDTRWEEGFSYLQDYVKQNGHARVPYGYEVDGYKLGVWVSNRRNQKAEGKLDADRVSRLENLHPTWTWASLGAEWEYWFSYLEDYVKQYGDARVPPSYEVDGHKLGVWVSNTRARYAKNKLSAERVKLLESVDGWVWKVQDAQWEEGFSYLQDYVKQHGDARVPYGYEVDGYKLRGWVQNQRANYAQGCLDPGRQHRLQHLPGWTWDTHADRWEEGFRRLQDYVIRNGDARVPASYTDDGYRLGTWVSVQRRGYTKGTLDADRRHRLQDLPGWIWKASSST